VVDASADRVYNRSMIERSNFPMSRNDNPLPLPDRVRESCRRVAVRARSVHIVEEKIPEYARSLPLGPVAFPEHDAATHYLGHGPATVAYFLTLDAVNFGSGYFPHLRKRPGMSGYFTVAASLADRFRESGPFSADELTASTPEKMAGIFGQDLAAAPVAELMELFAEAFRQLGNFLLEKFGGSFTAAVEAAGGSAVALAETVARIPFFSDVELYEGEEVSFYKRAQILPQDLALAFGGEGYGAFRDLDRLTIFADNLVPHVLRVDGILAYDPGLAFRIDREETIPAGSPEEVEIRASAVHAVELVAAALRGEGREIAPREIDFLLWNRGQGPFYKKWKPRHRTRTVFY
jgi:hypothetical protein